MKHNLLKSVILSVILLLGANSVWAWKISSAKIYYDDSNSNWSENVVVAFEKSDGGAVISMSKIANTKLHYWTGSWGDGQVSYMRFGKTTSTHDWYGWWTDVKNTWSLSTADSWSGVSNGWGLDIDNSYKMFGASSSDKGADLTKTDLTSYTSLNFNQTIAIQNYNTSNSKFEASNNTAGTVAAKYYKFSSANSVGTQQSASITNSTAISAAYTSTMTLTASAKSGYQFVGWYDGTTLLSKNTTYSHTVPNSTKTIYARFIKIDALNVPVYLKTGDWKNDGARFAVYAFEDNSGFQMWIDMSELDCSGSRDYFTCKVPANTKVIFCRMNPENATNDWSNKYNQTANLTVSTNNYWKFTAWDNNSDGNDEGSWGTYSAPTYTITLKADSHGTYNVTSGGTTQTSKLSGDVTMSVALNSKITITTNTPKPGYDQSQGAAITIGTNDKQKATLGTEYTICGPTTITGNFVTTEEQTVYLQPTGHWNGDNAQYKAFVFHDYGSKWMTSLMNNVTCETDDQACYTCTLPAGYHSVIFCRVKDNNVNNFSSDNLWNQTKDLLIPVNSENNCYQITAIGDKEQGEKSSGNWKTFAPTYTVTLKSSSYGLYNVSINGQTHHSNYKTDVVVENVPLGAQVEVYNVMPHNPEVYNEDIIVKRSSNANYERYTNNKTFTVCGNTTIAEDFVTKEAHTLYLGVPDAMITTEWWNLRKFIWAKNETTSELVESTRNFVIGTVTYYEITIPSGYNKFCFQSKAEGGSSTTKCQSIWFYNSIPTNNVNCFTLKDEYTTPQTLRNYKGDWSQLPAANGDFRVLYVEQEVANGKGSDSWKTVINTTYQHSSDIIKKRTATGTDIVSLHINYDETKHPRIILQQMSSGEWVDVEGQARMAVGPLTATADKAMAPGRRNAAGEGLLTYDDGIEEIKQDKQDGYAGRVWNFTVQQTVDNGNVTAKLLLENLEPYSGDYYIRTDNAEGGWLCYNQPNNVMPYSEYSLTHSGYSHYFCKWVEISNKPNTKFVVANEYGAAISDTLSGEFDENGNLLSFTDEHGNLTEKANVRWMWNEYTNKVSRAYIAGSTQDDFLKVFYADSKSTKFDDKGEWVYEVDLTDVAVDEKLTSIIAKYQGKEQQLLEKTHYDGGGVVMLASTGVARSTYTVRVVYDFKINQTLLYLLPTDQPVSTSIDVIIERINQDEGGNATQVKATITPADKEKGLTVYGVITLTKDHITDPKKSEQGALTYWISFPFDVNIADIFGFGEHGKDWILRQYNGKKRAEKGWFLDTPTFWERISEGTLKANTGYVLALHTRMLNESCPLYDNTSTLKLYFPSKDKITENITADLIQTECSIPEHICTIEKPRDRRDADSNWNFIGVPSFANKNNKNSDLNYFYEYDFATDTYSAEKNVGPTTFRSMHAYMVQFGGTIDWRSIADNNAQQLAAKKNASAEDNYELRLELQQNGAKADQTFVELQAEGATEMFDMNIDLAKMFNSGANIYTIIGESKTEAAANVLPIANTVIPVGVQVATAGEYTFAMPDGTDGVVVELIDYEYNTKTNLLFSEYTVNLPAGTNDTRFALSVKPDKTATSMENITTPSDGELRKFIIDGVLYMQKDGVLYDAQGKLVR